MQNCIFCKIIKGEIPCYKVYEDKDTLAFLDISPVNQGHTLVIPKEHYQDIGDIPVNTLNKVINTVQKISKAILKTADGVNLAQSNRAAAQQEVMHLHFHIIPRYKEDKKLAWPHTGKYKVGEAEQVAEKIIKEIKKVD